MQTNMQTKIDLSKIPRPPQQQRKSKNPTENPETPRKTTTPAICTPPRKTTNENRTPNIGQSFLRNAPVSSSATTEFNPPARPKKPLIDTALTVAEKQDLIYKLINKIKVPLEERSVDELMKANVPPLPNKPPEYTALKVAREQALINNTKVELSKVNITDLLNLSSKELQNRLGYIDYDSIKIFLEDL